MLMNKIPVLDKGYVAYLQSSCNGDLLKKMALEFFKTTDISNISDLGSLTVVIRCPLFVQLNLSKFNLKIISLQDDKIEAFVTNPGEIGASDLETSRLISDDIDRTTEALLLNPTAYQTDGCNRFISQIMMPISTYTTLVVQGQYKEFLRFINQPNLPEPVKGYTAAIKNIIDMEWRNG